MTFKCLSLVAPLMFANIIWGGSQQRPDLNGNWRIEPSESVLHSHVPSQLIWQIEQTDNGIHLIQRFGDNKVDDLNCGTDGKDCKIKDVGHSAVICFYYNGPVLVELETEGQNRDTVIKKRMSVSKDGSRLTVDIAYLVPAGKPPEKLVLTREPATH
jgi:hypothetical protein